MTKVYDGKRGWRRCCVVGGLRKGGFAGKGWREVSDEAGGTGKQGKGVSR